MKKLIFSFAAVLFLFSCSTDDVIPPESELPKLKTITELTYTGSEVWGEPVRGQFMYKNIQEFDEMGNATVYYSYDIHKTETWIFRTVYEFDNNSRYLRGNQYLADGKVCFTYKMTYDDSRNALEWNVSHPDGKVESIWVEIFDNKKNVIEERNCDLQNFDNYNKKTTYKYDAKNNVIEEKEYYNGKLYSTTTYYYPEFDSNGSWTKMNEYYAKVGDDPVLVRMYERVNEYY